MAQLLGELIENYEDLSDEELEQIIMSGRLAREELPKKEKAAKKEKAGPTIDLSDFD